MKKEAEIVGEAECQTCYQEVSTLARLFIHVAEEIHAAQMTKCDFQAVDTAIRGGWHKENLPYTEIAPLCEIMQRAIGVLTAYGVEAASHQHPVSGPYWGPEEDEEEDFIEAGQPHS